MHPRIICEVRHEIAYPLTLLFNKSLESQQIPKIWKCANISPIFTARRYAKRGICRRRVVCLC